MGRIRKEEVYVEITYTRPIPLEHSVYLEGNFIRIMDTQGVLDLTEYMDYRKNRYRTTQQQQNQKKNPSKNPQKFKKTEDQGYKDLINDLNNRDLLPCVLFAFSRDKVDQRGQNLAGLKLITDGERFKILKFAEKALKRLNPVDRALPQILFVQELLSFGIGVHHSGHLPILKEIVEILFSKGLVKVLVATETFAMGVNMPTKSVIFCDTRKFDGSKHRDLLPGEYTQMSGRAGRRGKDVKGTVIIFFQNPDRTPREFILEEMLKAEPTVLESKFRIRYNQLCRILKSEELDLNEIVKNSFKENAAMQNYQSKLEISMIHRKKQQKLVNDLSMHNMEELENFMELGKRLKGLSLNVNYDKKPVDGGYIEVFYENCNLPGIIVMKSSHSLKTLLFDVDETFPNFKWVCKGIAWIIQDVPPCNLVTVYQSGIPKNQLNSLRSIQNNPAKVQELVAPLLQARHAQELLNSKQYFKGKSSCFLERDQLVNQFLSHP